MFDSLVNDPVGGADASSSGNRISTDGGIINDQSRGIDVIPAPTSSLGGDASATRPPADFGVTIGAADPGLTYVPSGYRLVFDEEFSESALDTQRWNTLAPWGVPWYSDSHQQQAFVPAAISLKNGIASLTADHANGDAGGQPYASGSLTTNRTFTYGYFEARVNAPAGKGLWPAFWLTSSRQWPPEWDIFELVDGVCYGYQHFLSGGQCAFVDGAAGSDSAYAVPNPYGVYHVYGFEWTPSDLYWYVDGVRTEHYAVNAAAGTSDPFWLNVSLQVGGDWPGDPDSLTAFPARLTVDYVRVYQLMM